MKLALDLDGTLITCEPRQSAALRIALNMCGAYADCDAVWNLKRSGLSTESALRNVGLEGQLSKEISDNWKRIVEDPLLLSLDSVLPQVENVITEMSDSGYSLCLITARSRPEWVKHQLRRLGLLSWFSTVKVISHSNSVTEKSDALLMGAPLAYFGDTEFDCFSAKKAGIPFYAVVTGQRSDKFWSQTEHRTYYPSLLEAWRSFVTSC